MLLQLALQLTDACQRNACEDDDDVYASLSPHSSLRLFSTMPVVESPVTRFTRSVTCSNPVVTTH